jgi:hypothetical protein
MTPLKLNRGETQLVLHCKHHGQWEKKEGIIALYKNIYQYEENTEGIYSMISKLFYKIWEVQGKEIRHLENVLSNSLPSQNWKVGGHVFPGNVFSFSRPEDKFNENEILWAQIHAMCSYISLTEIKYLELAEKDSKWILNPDYKKEDN